MTEQSDDDDLIVEFGVDAKGHRVNTRIPMSLNYCTSGMHADPPVVDGNRLLCESCYKLLLDNDMAGYRD